LVKLVAGVLNGNALECVFSNLLFLALVYLLYVLSNGVRAIAFSLQAQVVLGAILLELEGL
jgi:hypothetical protein